jgi:predicted NBD/HSP70 family sugar kinase
MTEPRPIVVVGIDVGGTKTNATVLDVSGAFLVDHMVETSSRVSEGPDAALEAIAASMEKVLAAAGIADAAVLAVGLDTPGPASAIGVISSKGSTNFQQPVWRGYDIRSAVESRLGLPVIYNNDGNAAALYAHEHLFGAETLHRSSVAAIVGTGLGGGVVERGHIVRGASGMAGEFGHVQISLDGVLGPDQPIPSCNCGQRGDLESVASLSAIERNLLPYWLSRFPGHPLAAVAARSPAIAARDVRRYGEEGDELALRIFAQQAAAIGRMFTIASNYTDPDAYFVGGGVVESAPAFRDWFVDSVRSATSLRDEQLAVARFAVVADLDMAGARGSALAALRAIRPERDPAL